MLLVITPTMAHFNDMIFINFRTLKNSSIIFFIQFVGASSAQGNTEHQQRRKKLLLLLNIFRSQPSTSTHLHKARPKVPCAS